MLDELVAELRKHDRAEIAFKSGVSIGTINALMCGANKNPQLSTVEALQKFLEEKQNELSGKGC